MRAARVEGPVLERSIISGGQRDVLSVWGDSHVAWYGHWYATRTGLSVGVAWMREGRVCEEEDKMCR